MPSSRFVLDEVRLPGAAGRGSILVEGGLVAAIGRVEADPDVPRYDAAGAWLSAGFTDAHVHLDKAMLTGRCPVCEGTLGEAVRLTAAAKRDFSEDDVHERGSEVLDMAVRAGTRRLRGFVEVDPRAGLRSLRGVVRLAKDWADLIDVEICAFAQEGLTQEPETLGLLAEALGEGAHLIGGCPYTDSDPVAHVRAIFDLAARFDVDVDFHADFDLDPEGSILPEIVAETVRRGWQGRVAVGHATKLAAVSPERRARLAAGMIEAGIALVVLPFTDLFLNGSRKDPLRPRGLAPAFELAAAGMTVALATNNVQNPFTPYGDASLLRAAQLYANLDHLSSDADLGSVMAMITRAPAQILHREPPPFALGQPADFILLAATSEIDALRRVAPVTGIVRNGRVRLWAPVQQLSRGV